MRPVAHPARLLKRGFEAVCLSTNRLSLPLGVSIGRVTKILNGSYTITAVTSVRLSLYFGQRPCIWLALQSQFDIALVERDRDAKIARQVQPTGT